MNRVCRMCNPPSTAGLIPLRGKPRERGWSYRATDWKSSKGLLDEHSSALLATNCIYIYDCATAAASLLALLDRSRRGTRSIQLVVVVMIFTSAAHATEDNPQQHECHRSYD